MIMSDRAARGGQKESSVLRGVGCTRAYVVGGGFGVNGDISVLSKD